MLDSWIRIDADGSDHRLHRQGRARPGHQDRAASRSPPKSSMVEPRAHPARHRRHRRARPNEGYTAGSQSMQDSGTAILHAAAQVRAILVELAAAAPRRRRRRSSTVQRRRDRARRTAAASPTASSSRARRCTCARSRNRRCAIRRRAASWASRCRASTSRRRSPASAIYVQDLRLPGMVHARVVRPPSYGARLLALRHRRVEKMPGVLKIVRNGSFLAVVAEREYQAVGACARSRAARSGKSAPALPPPPTSIHASRSACRRRTRSIVEREPRAAPAAGALEATYRRPYQMHASIGPSCAVGAAAGRRADDLVAHPGRLSAARRDRRDAARAARARALHPHGRLRLLRPQRRRRRRPPMRRSSPPRFPAGRCACSGCARTSTRGSRTAR